MRQLSFLFAFLLFSYILTAQVGVGTDNPQGVFHVDGQSNNPSNGNPNASEASDDVVVTNQGNVGVGIINPDKKLTIDSGENNVSGLRLSQLNNSSPLHDKKGVILGTDNQGNVIPVINTNCIPDYYVASAGNSSHAIPPNTVITTFDQKVTSNGILQTPNGFLLKAERLYRLEAALYLTSTSNAARSIKYEWRTGNTRIPNQNHVFSANSTNYGGNQQYAVAYIKPSSDTYVTIVGVSRSVVDANYWGGHSYILIEQLSPCSR